MLLPFVESAREMLGERWRRARSGPPWGRPPALLTVAAAILVTASFVLSTVLSQYRLRRIDRNALDLATSSAPGIVEVARTQGDLRELGSQTERYLSALARGEHPSDVAIGHARDDLHAALEDLLSSVHAMPESSRPRTEAALAGIDTSLDQLLAKTAVGRLAAAEAIDEGRLQPALDAASTTLRDVIEESAQDIARQAARIERARYRATEVALVSDALGVLLAVALTGLVVAAMARYARLVGAYHRSVERRAAELEEFAGRVAHDLRSPLGVISLALGALREAAARDEKLARNVQRGMAAVGRSDAIIEALLSFARAGAPPVESARTDVGTALTEIIDGLQPQAGDVGVDLRLESPPSATVACASGVLASLVSNLVTNAIKYLGEGPVRRVTVRASRRDGALHVEVEDTGPGVPSALADSIFEPYIRGPGSGRPGIGLGLATVRRLAVAHHGAVGVESIPGHGSRFWFELPLAREPG